MKCGDGRALSEGIRTGNRLDAELSCAGDGLCEFRHRHGILRMVEEGRTRTCLIQRLGQEMPHAASRLQTLHRLCRDDDRVGVLADIADIGEGAGEVDLQPRFLGGGIGSLCKRERFLAVEIGFRIDNEERCKTALHDKALLYQHEILPLDNKMLPQVKCVCNMLSC